MKSVRSHDQVLILACAKQDLIMAELKGNRQKALLCEKKKRKRRVGGTQVRNIAQASSAEVSSLSEYCKSSDV